MPYVGVVKADKTALHVRGDPNTVRVARAAKGDLVVVRKIGGSQGAWCECLYSKPVVAYISAEHVKKIDERNVEVVGNRVFLRPVPSKVRQHFCGLEAGTRLALLGEKDGFCRVVAPDDVPVWILREKVGHYGSMKEFGEQFRKARANSLAAMLGSVAAVPGGTGGAAGTGGVPAVTGKAAAAPVAAAAPGDDEGKPYLARLATLGKRFESENAAHNMNGLKSVLTDLEKLEKEALGLSNERTRFKVSYRASQLITKAKLAIIELEHAAPREARATAPDPVLQPESGSLIKVTGWIKREGGAFSRRTLYRLEKGKVVLYYLMSPRYELAKFANKHVALTGEVLPRKDPLASKVLEVKRLKILSH